MQRFHFASFAIGLGAGLLVLLIFVTSKSIFFPSKGTFGGPNGTTQFQRNGQFQGGKRGAGSSSSDQNAIQSGTGSHTLSSTDTMIPSGTGSQTSSGTKL